MPFFSMFFSSYYYYITIALQAICVWHCLKKGNQQKWIWIIVFLPLVGCLIYFFSEILSDRQIRNVGSNVGSMINPTGSVRRLEEQLRFADTHQNKVALADAYLETGETAKAIHLYEESLTGVFDENEYVLMKLIIAYSKVKFYEGIIPLAERASKSPQFARSQAHIEYAKALAALGQNEKAEKEFNLMLGKFANYEPRYHYGLYLLQKGETDQARRIFREMMEEEKHLGQRERRMYKAWINKAKEEMKKADVTV
jgi:hypothetical protein